MTAFSSFNLLVTYQVQSTLRLVDIENSDWLRAQNVEKETTPGYSDLCVRIAHFRRNFLHHFMVLANKNSIISDHVSKIMLIIKVSVCPEPYLLLRIHYPIIIVHCHIPTILQNMISHFSQPPLIHLYHHCTPTEHPSIRSMYNRGSTTNNHLTQLSETTSAVVDYERCD